MLMVVMPRKFCYLKNKIRHNFDVKLWLFITLQILHNDLNSSVHVQIRKMELLKNMLKNEKSV